MYPLLYKACWHLNYLSMISTMMWHETDLISISQSCYKLIECRSPPVVHGRCSNNYLVWRVIQKCVWNSEGFFCESRNKGNKRIQKCYYWNAWQIQHPWSFHRQVTLMNHAAACKHMHNQFLESVVGWHSNLELSHVQVFYIGLHGLRENQICPEVTKRPILLVESILP